MGYQLILDTSSKYMVVGLADENELIDSIQYPAWQRQSEVAMIEVENILKKNGVNIKDVNKIIVSKGPGSYTGIRIALTIAKVLALTLNCDIVTVSSLEVFIKPKGKYISVIDARSKRAYVGRYIDGVEIEKDSVLTIDELKVWIGNNPDFNIVGETRVLGFEEKETNIALNMYEIAKTKEKTIDIDALVPVYLKDNYDN